VSKSVYDLALTKYCSTRYLFQYATSCWSIVNLLGYASNPTTSWNVKRVRLSSNPSSYLCEGAAHEYIWKRSTHSLLGIILQRTMFNLLSCRCVLVGSAYLLRQARPLCSQLVTFSGLSQPKAIESLNPQTLPGCGWGGRRPT
jgi:hypothetical protein